ncbi:MAG: DUF5058 family protein [Clostridiales bacterium]|jgi:hypothetical protein|nr:DUF5058 family protein [Clostridiales bacterium]
MNDFLAVANSAFMYLVAGTVILAVVAMSTVFMIRAYREGIRLGIDKKKLQKAMTSSAAFTAVPSISILLGVLALAGKLGVPIPWLRLSVVGALQYESVAAQMAATGLGVPFTLESMNESAFVGIIFVMTIGIVWGGLFCIFGLKKYQSRITGKPGKKDARWGQLMFTAMFIGMVCAFVGAAFSDLRGYGDKDATFLSLAVMIISSASMAAFTYLVKNRGIKWLENFSLSFSMIIGMTFAVILKLAGVR